MQQYLDTLRYVLNSGHAKTDRTGTGTISVFGQQMRFDLANGFPLVTTKKIHFKSVVVELLWFLSGSTNVKDLQAMGCTIWDEWANETGDLGPMYGKQWRSWNGIDQIERLVTGIKCDPHSRRHVVSAWNVSDLPSMALAPCHAMFQMDVTDGKLSCQLYQRSADMFLGVPFNIASYALLTHMVAQQCNLNVGEFIWVGGDCHIYMNHLMQVDEQLARFPTAAPALNIKRKPDNIFGYRPDDFELVDYQPWPAIPGPVAV